MSNTIAFDAGFYATQNQDVAFAISKGQFTSYQQHYDLFGRFEGRNPNAFFNTAFYLQTYQDVARAGVNPLTHFLTSGAAEGRFANANEKAAIDLNNNGGADDFNEAAYRAQYSDVDNAIKAGTFKNAYQHFVQFGQFEGRTATLANGTTITGPFSNTGSGTGNFITLTNGLDGPNAVAPAANTNGTTGDDIYLADNNTLSADTINGNAGNDTLRVTTAAGANYAPTLNSVERIEASTPVANVNAVFDLTNASGLQAIARTSGAGNLAVQGLKNIVSLENGAVTGGTLAVTYAAATVAGTTDTQKISFSGTTSGNVTVNGIETFDVTSTGTNTITSLISDSLSSVKFAGAGSTTVTNALTGATTVDASTATGSIKVVLDAAKNVTATGGTGNDVFNFGTGFNAQDKVDGGAGTDYIGFSDLANGLTANASNISNIEGILIATDTGATNGTINVDNFVGNSISLFRFGNDATVNSVGIANGNTANITNAVTGSTVFVNVDDAGTTGALTFGLKNNGSADVLNLKLINTDTTGVAETHGLASLTADQIETINIDSSKLVLAGTTIDANDIVAINTLTSASATTLTLTGNTNISLGATASTLTSLATIEASAVNGNVSLGSDAAAFSTSVTGAAITTGAGNDFVSLNVGNAGALKAIALGADTLASGGAGDTLVLSGGGSLNGVTIVDLSSTTDQVSQLLGSANAAAQTGIENINLALLNGTAQITGTGGNNTIVGTANADAISAGAGNDIIQGGAGADSITGGAGSDIFRVLTRAESNTAAFDSIQDFVSGTDKFDFAGSLTLVAGQTTGTNLNANTQTFDTDLATTFNAAITAVGANSFTQAGDTMVVTITGGNADQNGVYVINNLTGNGFAALDDVVVKLVGSSSTTLTVADFQ
ncbi:beta strand repeat-containing protein [Aureimonas ureilytica]|uniref:beta strand repeat-containing protein n=1 Tax=Aureimonas ureilytica TaxID=401562 RepID=UPI003CF9CE9F